MNTLRRILCPVVLAGLFSGSALCQEIAPPTAAGTPGADVTAGSRREESVTVNALVGYVNAEPIFVQDILRPIDSQLQALAANSRNLTTFRSAARSAIHVALQNYLFEIMIGSKAKAALSDGERQQVDIVMAMQQHDLLATHGGSRALADQELRARGSSVDKEMADARRALIINLYFRKELLPKVVVTRQMVLDAYQHEPKKWQKDAELELFTISIPVKRWLREPGSDGTKGDYLKNPTAQQVKEAEAQAMATGRELVDRVKKGEDFAVLAEDYSADKRANYGGRYPHVKRGSMANQQIENYVFTLPAHTVGEPQLVHDADPLQETVMVVKVGDKQDAHKVSFVDAQKDIADDLQQQQYGTLKQRFLEKLSSETPVENQTKMEDTVLDVAVTRYAMAQ